MSIYILGRLIDLLMNFFHLNNLASRRVTFFVRTLGILLPTFIGILIFASIATLNVPINFLIVVLLGLLFGRYLKDYIAGLMFRTTSKALIEDSIIIDGIGGEILSLDTLSMSLQNPKGRFILPYSILYQQGYTITKKLHVANKFDIVIDLGEGEIDFEQTKSDLISILSNGGYIGKFTSPSFKINHHTNQVSIQIYLDSMDDPMDLILLLMEKNYICH